MIRDVHPRSGSWFFTHPGSGDQKGSGSRIRICNTDIRIPLERNESDYHLLCFRVPQFTSSGLPEERTLSWEWRAIQLSSLCSVSISALVQLKGTDTGTSLCFVVVFYQSCEHKTCKTENMNLWTVLWPWPFGTYGSGSTDPYRWDTGQDPALFVSGFQAATKSNFFCFLLLGYIYMSLQTQS